MRFAPSDPAEQTQVRIFSGDPQLTADFDAAFIRVRPSEFADLFATASLTPRTVSAGDLRRASDVFDDYIGQTFNIDLRDLSRERWSLDPDDRRSHRGGPDPAARQPHLCAFDEGRRGHLALRSQASPQHRGLRVATETRQPRPVLRRGRARRIRHSPPRSRRRLQPRSDVGRGYRDAQDQDPIDRALVDDAAARRIADRPQRGDRGTRTAAVSAGHRAEQRDRQLSRPRSGATAEISLHVTYGGRLEPQQIDREGIVLDQQGQANVQQEELYIPVEPQYIYSNRNYWYPQSTVTDYADQRACASRSRRSSTSSPAGAETEPPAPAPGAVPPGQRAAQAVSSSRPIGRCATCPA